MMQCSFCGRQESESPRMWQCKGCMKVWCQECLGQRPRDIIGNRECTCGYKVGLLDRKK